jgi:hypothetical protein
LPGFASAFHSLKFLLSDRAAAHTKVTVAPSMSDCQRRRSI